MRQPLLSEQKITYHYVVKKLEELNVSSCCGLFSASARIKGLQRRMNAGVLESNFNNIEDLAPQALYEYCYSCGVTEGWEQEKNGYGSVSSIARAYKINSEDSAEIILLKEIANHGAVLKAQQVNHSRVTVDVSSQEDELKDSVVTVDVSSQEDESKNSIVAVAKQLSFLSKKEEETGKTIAQRFTVTELQGLKSALKDIRKTKKMGKKEKVTPENKRALISLANSAIYLLQGLSQEFVALARISAKSKKRAMPYIYPKYPVSGGGIKESTQLCSQFGAFGAGADIGSELRKFVLPSELDEKTATALEQAKTQFVTVINQLIEKAVSTASRQDSPEHSMKMYALHCVLKKFGDAEQESSIYEGLAQQRDIYKALLTEDEGFAEKCTPLYNSMRQQFSEDYSHCKKATKEQLAAEAPQGVALNSGSGSDSL